MRAFNPNNIPAIVNAVEQVLGAGHPTARSVQAAATDPDLVREAWNAIEALPVDQRRFCRGWPSQSGADAGYPINLPRRPSACAPKELYI